MRKFAITCLSIIALIGLSACGNYLEKTFVYEEHQLDDYGEPIITYKECSALNLLNLDPACHIETVHPKYCYSTLGEIECHDSPLPHYDAARRVK